MTKTKTVATDPFTKLSDNDVAKLQLEKMKLQNAQLSFQLFLSNIYRIYQLDANDGIDDNGNIVRPTSQESGNQS